MKITRTLTLLLTLLALSPAAQARPLTPEDLVGVRRVGSPAVSPDGRTVYYTVTTYSLDTNRGATRLWAADVQGKTAPRPITATDASAFSPAVSPDGKTLAFVTRRDGRYLVAVKDLAGGAERVLSDGGREEAPSFAPNGRWLMYSTQAGGRDSLMAVTLDGRVKLRLNSSAGDIREPTWGPFPQ